jgi:hypothetical protein
LTPKKTPGATCLQDTYIQKVLQKYNTSTLKLQETPLPAAIMEKFNGNASSSDVKAYQGMVGSVLYAFISTRPDIARTKSWPPLQMQQQIAPHFVTLTIYPTTLTSPPVSLKILLDRESVVDPILDHFWEGKTIQTSVKTLSIYRITRSRYTA